MSRNFELLQQTSSVRELVETSGNPAGLAGTAECEPSPARTEKSKQKAARSEAPPIHLSVGTAECEPSPARTEKPRQKAARSEAPPIHLSVGTAECEPSPARTEKPKQKAARSEAGCAAISIRTAEILAGRGDGSVCVVDANFQLPCLHHYFGIDNSKGLAEVALGSLPIQDSLQKHPEAN